jgi:hypothetical protein
VAKVSGSDASSPTSSRQFRGLLPYVLAICIGAISQPAAAATFWQLQQPQISVFVEGDNKDARYAAETILRLQSAARWLLGWPDSYREPPVLVFVVNERLLRHTF